MVSTIEGPTVFEMPRPRPLQPLPACQLIHNLPGLPQHRTYSPSHNPTRLPEALTHGVDEVGAVRVRGVAEDEAGLAHVWVADGDHLERVLECVLRPRDGGVKAFAGHVAEPLVPVASPLVNGCGG